VKDPAIAVDHQDRVHVVWTENRYGNFEIFYSRLEANGSQSFDTVKLVQSPGDVRHPVLATGQGDLVHLAFEDGRTGSYQVYLMALNSSGGIREDDLVISGPEMVSLDYKATHPDLAVDQWGGIHMVWEGFDLQNHHYIHYFHEKDGRKLEMNLTDPNRHDRNDITDEAYQGVGVPSLAIDDGGVSFAFTMRTEEDDEDSIFLCRFPFASKVPDFESFLFPGSLWKFPLEHYTILSVELGPVENDQISLVYSAEMRENTSVFYGLVPLEDILGTE